MPEQSMVSMVSHTAAFDALAGAKDLTANLRQTAEGKTKIIYAVDSIPAALVKHIIATSQCHKLKEKVVVVRNKDRITAFNNERKDEVVDKGRLSNLTNSAIFAFLGGAGIRTHFVGQLSETEFVADKCSMVPLEWVIRRVATGSFLKRFTGVKEGTRFNPPLLEICFKDDDQGDPVWTKDQVLQANLEVGGRVINGTDVEMMSRTTVAVFEILERAWARLGCTLVDMKIEFGRNQEGDIVLADVIDSDSWRLWPNGDKRLQLDKQFYRDLATVTPEDLAKLKTNFQHVVTELEKFTSGPEVRAVILMGSEADTKLGEDIRSQCANLAIPALLRVTSAHKGTEAALAAIAEYEGDGIPTVIIAIAGRSNGLGPVSAGNTTLPVISCPPLSADWGAQDVWSSLRLPSGLGAPTVIGAEAAALSAAAILGAVDHRVFARLRVARLNQHLKLAAADARAQAANQMAQERGAFQHFAVTAPSPGNGHS